MSKKKEPVTGSETNLKVDDEEVVRCVLYDADEELSIDEILEKTKIKYPTVTLSVEKIKKALSELKDFREVYSDDEGRFKLSAMGRLHKEEGEHYWPEVYANFVRRSIMKPKKTEVEETDEKTASTVKKVLKSPNKAAKSNKEVKTDGLELLSVNKITACKPKGERKTCIVIDKNLDSESVEHDVKCGAVQYKCVADADQADLSSKVSVIRAQSQEDALLAASYLCAKHSEMDGVDKKYEYISPENVELPDYEPCGRDDTFMNVCPIVQIGEFINRDSVSFGMGSVSTNVAGIRNTADPYWFRHVGPAVLVCAAGAPMIDPENNLLCDAISALGEKSRIYVVFIENQYFSDCFLDEDMGEEIEYGDPKLIAVIERFDAAVYDICVKDRKGYMNKVLTGLCEKYDLTIPADYPKDQLLQRLEATYTDDLVMHLENMIRREKKRSKDGTLGYGPLKLLAHVDSSVDDSKEGREKLNSLEGMDHVKQEIESCIDSMKLGKARRLKGMKSEATACIMFTGAPGTGKTEVAGCLAKMLSEEGVLPGKRFISLTAAGLQGQYVGHTVGRVEEIFAQNDVIFLDEAYSLSDLMKQHVPFAEEAMATLLCKIEEAQRLGNKLVILGGYGGSKSDTQANKMAEFLKSNPGIRSRVAMTIEFESYSAEEMGRIFIKICNNTGYEFTPEMTERIRDKVKAYFETRVGKPDFGNAREARQLVAESARYAATRIMRGRNMAEVSEDELKSMTEEDVYNAIESVKKMALSQNGRGERTLRMIG